MADQMAKELTDDTTVIEAPSFIVPYIYEKTPLTDKNSNDVSGKNKPASLQSPEETRIISSNFAGSTLFKLTAGLGEDLVQEFVHRDMIYKEQRRPKIDRNEANITALKENLLSIQKNTEDFHLKLKVCPECPFQTESTLTLEHHMEKIHRVLHHEMHQDLLNLKNLDFYRCNICYYQTKNPSEMMKHLQEEMTKLEGKSRKGSSPFTAPQFLFDDRLKGKLRRELECAKKRKLETSPEQHEAVKKSNAKNEPIVSKTANAKENSGLILKSMEELTGLRTIAPTKCGVLQESKFQNHNSSQDSDLKSLAGKSFQINSELNTDRFVEISKNLQGKALNSSNLEVKENDKSGVLYKHKFREGLQVYLDPVTKELASKPSKEVMDYLEETPSITLKDWITADIFFKAPETPASTAKLSEKTSGISSASPQVRPSQKIRRITDFFKKKP